MKVTICMVFSTCSRVFYINLVAFFTLDAIGENKPVQDNLSFAPASLLPQLPMGPLTTVVNVVAGVVDFSTLDIFVAIQAAVGCYPQFLHIHPTLAPPIEHTLWNWD